MRSITYSFACPCSISCYFTLSDSIIHNLFWLWWNMSQVTLQMSKFTFSLSWCLFCLRVFGVRLESELDSSQCSNARAFLRKLLKTNKHLDHCDRLLNQKTGYTMTIMVLKTLKINLRLTVYPETDFLESVISITSTILFFFFFITYTFYFNEEEHKCCSAVLFFLFPPPSHVFFSLLNCLHPHW